MRSILSFIILLFYSIISRVQAQFPAICAANLTTSLPAVCCPIPEGSSIPCGGPNRGTCRELLVPPEDLSVLSLDQRILQDDRLNWPTKFVRAACVCQSARLLSACSHRFFLEQPNEGAEESLQGNFEGYACHQCKPGWTGSNCHVRKPMRQRRNVLDLSVEEQKQFRDRILLAKRTPMTEWVVLNITDSSNGDPISIQNIQLIQPPSVYDFFVYLHLYASRSTLIMNNTNDQSCDANVHLLDFAHKGAGFLTWHRAHLLFLERELEKLNITGNATTEQLRNGDNFALPYWDWTAAVGCSICTNNLIGSFNQFTGQLDSTNEFSTWITYCPQRSRPNDCHVCDPGLNWADNPNNPMAGGPLWRKQSNVFTSLPNQEDVDITLNTVDYDVWPYKPNSGSSSFRNLLEGFADPRRSPLANNKNNNINNSINNNINSINSTVNNLNVSTDLSINQTNIPYMHNLVHSYFNGSWFDVSTSPNDPLFVLHHTFVDKLFELWLRRNRPSPNQYPTQGCPPGHNAYSPIVPFFPVVENIAFFVDSRSLGYDYDNYRAGTNVFLPVGTRNANLALNRTQIVENVVPIFISSIVLSIILLIATISSLIFIISYIKRKQAYYTVIDTDDLTNRPTLAALNTWHKARDRLSRKMETGYEIQDEKTKLLNTQNY